MTMMSLRTLQLAIAVLQLGATLSGTRRRYMALAA